MSEIPGPGDAVLAISAHPDDMESWCAGTLALAVDRGATGRHVVTPGALTRV